MRILIGEPVKGTEANALRRLYQSIKNLDGLLLANFYLGPRQFDFVIVLPEYTALIELKSLSGAAFGGQNGNWSIRDLTGEPREYPGLNPWGQAVAQAHVLSDEMARFQKAHQNAPTQLNGQFYREFETIACIYPSLHPDSKIEVTSFKAEVIGFDDLTSTIISQKKIRSWQISDWERFATEFLNLQTVSLEQALDAKVHNAHSSIKSYLKRLRDTYGHDLAPLPVAIGDSIRGRALIDRLMEPRHQMLIGPSGSCKSFHLRHLVLSLGAGGTEVPIPVDPKGYGGGEISHLLQQSTSPFSASKVGKLVGDIAACGLRPVLVIDALNECPEGSRARLIEKLQAFVLLREARLVLSDQTNAELPPEIKANPILMQLPEADEKVRIFSYYAGEPPSEGLAHFSQTFTNAFDLKIAGKSHARGEHSDSRWELYSRYVRDALHGTYVVASAFLRAIAGEMMESLTMAMRRDRFVQLAETFYHKEEAPLVAVEQLLGSRLLVSGDEYVFFEHELLLDFFKTQYLTRKTDNPDDLASDLSRPRNAHLLELALAHCDGEEAIEALLAKANDTKPLGLALRGHCGPLAQAAVRKLCIALIALGVDESSNITVTCQTFERDNGKKGLVGFNITGRKPLSAFGTLLCGVIAENFEDQEIQKQFLRLLELTDTSFLDAVRHAAEESDVSVRAAYSEALRSYGGILFHGGGSPFICAGILSAIRHSRMMSSRDRGSLPILRSLVENVRQRQTSYFSFFALLIDLQSDSSGLELDEVLDLVQIAWNTGIGWMRTEAVRILYFLHRRASTLGEEQVAKIRELLQGFQTNDVLVNTEILEALAGYDGFEPPVSMEDALTEMRDLVEAGDNPTSEQAETARIFQTTWPQYRRDAAYSVLGKIFEDIFMGKYFEAYGGLPLAQRKALLELAAMSSRPGFHIDWILWELLAISDAASLPIFHRFATELDDETSCTQDVVGAFLGSVRGYARFSEQPPPTHDGPTDDRKAWSLMASILFWSMKDADIGAANEKIALGWKTLNDELPFCFPDILQKINESQWLNKGHSVNLASIFPEQMRPLLETAIKNRKSLTSLFRHGGSSDERVLQTVIQTLEVIGNKESICCLESLTEDPHFGKLAVQAIHAIRHR